MSSPAKNSDSNDPYGENISVLMMHLRLWAVFLLSHIFCKTCGKGKSRQAFQCSSFLYSEGFCRGLCSFIIHSLIYRTFYY